jgi:hypothetical protein
MIPDAVLKAVSDGQGKDPTATMALSWAARYRVTDIAIPASIEHRDPRSGESQVMRLARLGCAGQFSMIARRDVVPRLTTCLLLDSPCASKSRGLIDEARPLIAS